MEAIPAPGWSGFAGGIDDNGIAPGTTPKVYAVDAMTEIDEEGDTQFVGIWVTGAFRKALTAGTARNILKLTSSKTRWSYIGQGFQQFSYTAPCVWTPFAYQPFYGTTIARAGSTVYFGGFSQGHVRADGVALSTGSGCGCSFCPAVSGLINVGTASTMIDVNCPIGYVGALVARGNDLYAWGDLWIDQNFEQVHLGKLSAGVWTAILEPIGFCPNTAANSDAFVYFGGPYCWRYSP